MLSSNVIAKPETSGIKTLSFIGKGKYSTNIPIAAPNNANHGDMNTEAARKAKKKPHRDPSRVFDLLNSKGFLVNVPPISDAVLSPRQKRAMAALLAGAGKINSVSRMPRAK